MGLKLELELEEPGLESKSELELDRAVPKQSTVASAAGVHRARPHLAVAAVQAIEAISVSAARVWHRRPS